MVSRDDCLFTLLSPLPLLSASSHHRTTDLIISHAFLPSHQPSVLCVRPALLPRGFTKRNQTASTLRRHLPRKQEAPRRLPQVVEPPVVQRRPWKATYRPTQSHRIFYKKGVPRVHHIRAVMVCRHLCRLRLRACLRLSL